MIAQLAALLLAAAPPGTPSAPAGGPARPDDAELIRHLELLEQLELLDQLELLAPEGAAPATAHGLRRRTPEQGSPVGVGDLGETGEA